MGYKTTNYRSAKSDRLDKIAISVFSLVMIAFVGFFVWSFVAAISSAPSRPTKIDRFYEACEDRGGFVATTDRSFWSTRIDCIVNNEVVYLPGFA